MLRQFWTGLSELVYPPHCPLCRSHLPEHSSGDILCPPCRGDLSYNGPPFCPKCSRHLKDAFSVRCRECADHELKFDFAWAACLYRDPLKRLIREFKYNQKTYLRGLFARLMARFIEIYRLDIRQFDIIVPVPLFPARFRERGYNQSRLLAGPIAREYGIALGPNTFVRIQNTEYQAHLSEKERWTNIRGAFRIRNSSKIRGKNILIVDDLLTTGATASEAAGTLKDAGAGTVGVLTLAITV